MKRKPWAKSLAVHLAVAFALAFWGFWKTRPHLLGQSIEVTIADVHVHHSAAPKRRPPQKSVVMTQSSQKPAESLDSAAMNPPTTSGAAEGLSGSERDAYLSELMSLISRYQFYPRSAVLNEQEGVVRLRVVIDAAGALASLEVTQSSGYSILDDAAMVALKRVPVFPLPPGRSGPLALLVPVRYELNPAH